MKRTSVPLLVGLALAGFGATASLSSCTPNHFGAIYFAMDRSGSVENNRTDKPMQRYFGLMDETVASAPPGTQFQVYRFEGVVDKACTATSSNPRDFRSCQDSILKKPARAGSTRPDKLLAHLADVAMPQSPNRRIGIVIATDGENYGAPLKPIITRLARDKRIKAVLVVGVEWDRLLAVQEAFSPLGERAAVRGFVDAGDGLKRFRELLLAPDEEGGNDEQPRG